MASLKDVARHARVSTATVSRVLNHPEIVIPKTRERVERSLLTLKYIPSRVARRLRLRGGKTHIFGLLIPDIPNPFFSEVVRGVEDVTYVNNYALILCNADDDPDREKFYIDVMRAESVDGVLFLPIHETDPVAADMIRDGMPFVCVDRSLSNIDVDTVELDNYAGAYQAVELLIKNGHRRIGLVSGRPNVSTSRGRRLGYEDALRDNRIPLEKDLILKGDYRQESGRLLTEELLNLSPPPTALFVTNNRMTRGAIAVLHKRRLKIPDEIAIIGFDDFPWAEFLEPPLTVVRLPAYEMGRKAAELLLQRLVEPDREPILIRLAPELIIRKSCGSLESSSQKKDSDSGKDRTIGD